MQILSAAEAVSFVKSGDRVFFQGAAMTPNVLIDALCDRYTELEDVELFQITKPAKQQVIFSVFAIFRILEKTAL